MFDKSELITLMGAIVIFSILLINVNSFMGTSGRLQVQSELDYTAIALAQNIIDSARLKAFDESETGGKSPQDIPIDFSIPLAPETGENSKTFNDFDDYNNYSRIDTTEHEIYTSSVKVDYVNDTSLDQHSATQTTHKRMTVSVFSNSMQDTVKFTFIKTFYSK
ncbi:MAG TPA: hypothetical protein VJ991_14410 [Balneolales bacterium]|nr:hypothetical protein [Balneolales bacterium]